MVKRRSINQALSLTREQHAFIHDAPFEDGTNALESLRNDPESVGQLVDGPAEVIRSSIAGTSIDTQNSPAQIGQRHSRSKVSFQPITLVPLTTRLYPETAAALRRAYLERKLAGELPNTQQEIVEAALCTWLHSGGYLN